MYILKCIAVLLGFLSGPYSSVSALPGGVSLWPPLAGPRSRIDVRIARPAGWIVSADSVPSYNDMQVVQTVIYPKPCPDTVSLLFENVSVLDYTVPSFYVQELTVSALFPDDEPLILDYRLAGGNLSFVLPERAFGAVLTYRYVNDYFMKCGASNPCFAYLTPYNSGWHSWYFTCPGMEVDGIAIDSPDNYRLFINRPAKRMGNIYELDVSQAKGSPDFYTLDKSYYDTVSLNFADVSATLYLCRGAAYKEDSTALEPRLPAGTREPARYAERLRKTLERINGLMPASDPLKLYVADGVLRIGKVKWGCTIRIDDREYAVLIDTSDWRGGSLTHELLHVMDGRVMENAPKGDSAHYFFNESLIEYLAVCLDNPKPEIRDSVFRNKLSGNPDVNGSVFDVMENRRAAGDGSGSGSIVYDRTPWIIHKFAVEIGEDRFMGIFRDFYREARITGEVSLAALKRHALKYGVTTQEWDAFMRSL